MANPSPPLAACLGCSAHTRFRLSYNQKLWMLDLLKGATYPPS